MPRPPLRRQILVAATGLFPLLAFAAAPPRVGTEVRVEAPAFDWSAATPESEGFSTSKLDAFRDDLAARQTCWFLLLRDDRIIYEWYAPGFGPEKTHGTASSAKAMIGGVALAKAMDLTSIRLDDLASKYVPAWRRDPVKSRITVRELGSHTSGLADADTGDHSGDALMRQPGWMGDFWKRLPPPRDPFTLARDVDPIISPPGTQFHYSNPGIGMMCWCITAAIQSLPEKDIRSLLRDRVFRPIGIRDAEWSCGYNQIAWVDGLPLEGAWGGGAFTARAAARIGRLMLREGNWQGVQIISADSVRRTTCDSGLPNAINAGWWTNARGRVPALPRDAYWASGAGNQTLLIVPSMRLVMVRNGESLSLQDNDSALFDHLLTPLMGTLLPGSAARSAFAAQARGRRAVPAAYTGTLFTNVDLLLADGAKTIAIPRASAHVGRVRLRGID